ncbi:hypothetical protein Tco_0471742 [Tanacetum coccineum]
MLKDMQSLNGKLAALSRFLSKGAERSLPFFKVLKSCTDKRNIQWTQEAAAALQEMKKIMETLPTLRAIYWEKWKLEKTDTKLEETKPSYEWKLYTDGASSSDGSGT